MNLLQQIDENILMLIQQNLRLDAFTGFWRFITFLSEAGWFWIALGVFLLCRKPTREVAITALLSLALGFIITNLLLKNLIQRPRPFDVMEYLIPLVDKPTDWSFPSGHTSAAFSSALVYVRILPKRYGIPLVVLAVLTGFSRLYLGVHYPSDVVGGFLVGVFASFFVLYIKKKRWNKYADKQAI